MKQCEVCNKEIPEDYQNLLCDEHYRSLEVENSRLKSLEPSQEVITESKTPIVPVQGISDPRYKTNPQAEDKEQWIANMSMFERNGVILWKDTRWMYEWIRDSLINKIVGHPQYPKFIWKPKVVDVGCGIGLGSNILSQEADMVWGIDKNHNSVKFAQQAFSRVKNGIYYSSQVTFDVFDIMEETRETMKFDVVTAIEIIEHIEDAEGFIQKLISKFDNGKDTVYYISTPNRNNKNISKDKPKNPFHCREWRQEEFVAMLTKYFGVVEIRNAKGEPVGERNDHTPILAVCRGT